MLETIITNVLVGVGIVVVGWVAKIFSGWVDIQKEQAEQDKELQAKSELWEALDVAVTDTQVELVDGLKEAATDGKLSKDEIKAVRDKAIAKAVEVASGPAAELLTQMATDVLVALINTIVAGKKKE